MIVVDAHQHVWRLDRGDYGWLDPTLGVLYRDYLGDELAAQLASAGVQASVLVQAAASEAETRFLFEVAHAHDGIRGVVGWTDFAARDCTRRIEALVESGGGLLKGLRPMIQDIDDPEWVGRRELDAAFDALVWHDLAFDALVKPQHLAALRERLLRRPTLRGVIDHAAKPDIAGGAFEPWARDLARIANDTGAFCKLSGLLTQARSGAGFDELAPYVAHVFECFGPERVMWGSDWPVVNLVADYARWLDLARALVQRYARGHEDSVFGGAADTFYRLDLAKRPPQ